MSSTTINPKLLQIANIIAIFTTILMNSLANILPFNGVNTGEAADRFFSYFTPAGYVFGIWGIIYALLVIFAIYQARTNQRSEAYLGKIGFLYLLSAFFNITWLIAFHYGYDNNIIFLLTEPLIIGLLIVLLYTYVKLEIGITAVPLKEKLAIHLPISVYVGWLSVATIANTASILNEFLTIAVDIQYIWTALVLVVALLITMLMLVLRRDVAYGLVLIWASIGIAYKWTTVEVIPLIFWTASIVAVVVALAIILIPLLRKKNPINYYLVRD
jgi:benzodiazapine receptor